MIRAFLSHSSVDKDKYIREVAARLGIENIIYDELTFEEGEKPLDEILKGLNNTNLFVLFISENSLNSNWVKNEITEAKTMLDATNIDKIFPIIIDEKITYQDIRIPNWLRENYNLKPINKPSVAARRISTKLRELSWSKHPDLKKRNTIFVGRNDKLEQFEERVHDFDHPKPVAIIVSGFPGVGRRTFLHNALCKTNITEHTKKPSSILLDRNVSIEDFILKLNDLGLVDLKEDLFYLSDKSIEQKASIIHRFMNAAFEAKEQIYLIDDGCLINYERTISEWFNYVITSYNTSNFPIFCIIAKYIVTPKNRPKNEKYYFIEINELNTSERRRLLNQLLELYNVDLKKEDFECITDLLHGFPEQVMFAVDLIKEDNNTKLINKLPNIAQYNTDKAAALLRRYENDDTSLEFIRLLAQFEVINSDFIFSIVPEEKYFKLLEDFATEHIIELIGIDGEIIRLNDIVREFIKRNRLKLNPAFQSSIETIVKLTITQDDIFERDSSELLFTLKEALKSNLPIDEKLLIPSHYLRCMKDLYYQKGSLDRIIELADIILQKKKTLEKNILQDIWYYLCLALAKKKDQRLLQEVQNINGDEHIFLLGFYYRLCGRFQDALNKLEKIVSAPYVGARAKREIVQVYVQLEEYDKALLYAENNYEENRGNQFHAQAYFHCLINSEFAPSKSKQLNEIINNLRNIKSEQSIEMADIAEASFSAKIDSNKIVATDKILDCVSKYPENHYPLLTMCDIAIQYNDKEMLADGINRLKNLSKKRKDLSSRTLNKYIAYLCAFNGRFDEAISAIETDLARYPIDSKNRIIDMLRGIALAAETERP